MTLGNTPQPLTRRQLRELANDQATTGSAIEVDADAPTRSLPVSAESSFTELIAKADAAAKAAAVPRAGERRVATSTVTDEDYLDSLDRTLTRRELRALQVSQDDAADDTADDMADAHIDDAAPAAPVSRPEPAVRDIPVVIGLDEAERLAADRDTRRELHPPVGHWSIDHDHDDVEVGAEHGGAL
ncbi:MAG: hypothetical protein ABIO33_06900, partial [Leifsonia sp.]